MPRMVMAVVIAAMIAAMPLRGSDASEHFIAADGAPEEVERLLARELDRIWTRDSQQLVRALREARETRHSDVPLTFLLAIAHTETNGRILLVSEAGAVGLAQTTPIAFLEEKMQGRLFVTGDYVEGAIAYYLKKPLYDAIVITRTLLEGGDGSRERARRLLDSAHGLRREGIADLELLAPWGGADHAATLERLDRRNAAVLQKVGILIEQGATEESLREFQSNLRRDYDAMRSRQSISWKRYQDVLVARRDAILRREFAADPASVLRSRAWEASDLLAKELDERFSATTSADFLVRHVESKFREALVLDPDASDVPRLAAGLYNGGAHNLKRMRAGLLGYLRETENYMEKVPATRQRLEQAIAVSGAAAP